MPGSGPRRHDARQRLIAPLARRGTLLPPLHRCCPGDAERAGNAGDHAKLTPSTAAATTISRPPSSVLRRQPRPAQPRPKPPPNQITIDGNPPNQPPRVPSWGAFGRRPQHRWIAHDRPASETLHLLRQPADLGGTGQGDPKTVIRQTGDDMGSMHERWCAVSRRYLSSQTSSMRQPELMLLTMIVSPFTWG